jgi:hypothetical protein
MDVNQAAFQMVEESTRIENEAQPAPTKSDISRIMAEMGRKGGKIGGKRRLSTMTKADRVKVAKRAAQARWKKAKR